MGGAWPIPLTHGSAQNLPKPDKIGQLSVPSLGAVGAKRIPIDVPAPNDLLADSKPSEALHHRLLAEAAGSGCFSRTDQVACRYRDGYGSALSCSGASCEGEHGPEGGDDRVSRVCPLQRHQDARQGAFGGCCARLAGAALWRAWRPCEAEGARVIHGPCPPVP